jgi:hypothetical protein
MSPNFLIFFFYFFAFHEEKKKRFFPLFLFSLKKKLARVFMSFSCIDCNVIWQNIAAIESLEKHYKLDNLII